MKQLYLCGAISSNPNYKQDFENARQRLIEAGYSVVSPVIFCNENWSWKKCIRKCIEVMVRNKNLAIALIENDHKSEGRTLELIIARILDLEIKTVSEWVEARYGLTRTETNGGEYWEGEIYIKTSEGKYLKLTFCL